MAMAATALPAFILVWMRERTGSLVLPILLHNFANSIVLLL
jgi:membrane protease YdiL (CAAX protease family)